MEISIVSLAIEGFEVLTEAILLSCWNNARKYNNLYETHCSFANWGSIYDIGSLSSNISQSLLLTLAGISVPRSSPNVFPPTTGTSEPVRTNIILAQPLLGVTFFQA